jgi:hypothetical protein
MTGLEGSAAAHRIIMAGHSGWPGRSPGSSEKEDTALSDLDKLAERYVAIWNEPDAAARRAAVGELFTEDVAHFTPSMEVHGQDEMAARILMSYEKWVEPGGHVFRPAPGATGHHDAVRSNWHMVSVPGGDIISVGFDFVLVAEDGRIKRDYQFIDS